MAAGSIHRHRERLQRGQSRSTITASTAGARKPAAASHSPCDCGPARRTAPKTVPAGTLIAGG